MSGDFLVYSTNIQQYIQYSTNMFEYQFKKTVNVGNTDLVAGF